MLKSTLPLVITPLVATAVAGPARDTANAWEPKSDASFARLHPRGDEEPLDSKALLLEEGF
jgi:hypothetical protein